MYKNHESKCYYSSKIHIVPLPYYLVSTSHATFLHAFEILNYVRKIIKKLCLAIQMYNYECEYKKY